MLQNIHQNNTGELDCKLTYRGYCDYMLHKGGVSHGDGFEDHEVLNFTCPFNMINGRIYSSTTWKDAVSEGVNMEDIGFTGVDNGFIHYDKYRISNREFLELFTNSYYKIKTGDTRMFMTPVCGNTGRFKFPMYYHNDEKDCYIAFKGGFYQGFFKLYGFDYEVFPAKQMSDWTFHFELRPRSDYTTSGDGCYQIVNELHPENAGIFFFIGLRGENKMWEFYNASEEDRNDFIIDPDHKDDYNPKGDYYSKDDPGYLADSGYTTEYTDTDCFNAHYYGDDYYDPNCAPGGLPFDTNYMQKDVTIKEDELIETITDSGGHALGDNGSYDILSDNKFLLFDRTPSGVTTDTYEEGMKVKLMGKNSYDRNINLFMLMNRTPTGWTTDTIEEYYKAHKKEYDFYKDTKDNAFCLRITPEGAVGYRYAMLDCDNPDHHFTVVEEYTRDGLVKDGEWSRITVRFMLLGAPANKCEKNIRRKMKALIYVDGYLKLVSKELNAFNFRELDEAFEKQEGVPYNMSLGGGSLGLLEMITPDYYKVSNYCLPIEKYFCGTFIGDIRSFRAFDCAIEYSGLHCYLS